MNEDSEGRLLKGKDIYISTSMHQLYQDMIVNSMKTDDMANVRKNGSK